jgi:SAM-dependent methyltransferase
VNTYYQFRDIQSLGSCRKVLVVGVGQGFEAAVLKWKGYKVATMDIDERLKPDFVGSVHSMPMFASQEFDVAIASHVLEHFAIDYLDQALAELARVAKHVLVYLPVSGRHAQVRLIPGIRGWDISFILDLFNFFEKPDGRNPKYCSGMHFWEIGMRGFRVKDLTRRFSKYFEILSAYRNKDWLPSFNFVLKVKQEATS